jgi:hypothetical protein
MLLAVSLIAVFRKAQQFDPARIAMERSGRGPLGEINLQFVRPTIIARTAGIEDWRVKVDRIDVLAGMSDTLESYREVKFLNIHDGRFQKNGRPFAAFRAHAATYAPATQSFELTGEMHLRTVKGDRITSRLARWSEKDDFVRFPEGAEAVFEKNTLLTPQLLVEPRRRLVQCPIGGDAVLNGRKVRADALFWDVDRGIVECPGTVMGESKNMVFQSQSVVFNLKQKTIKTARGRIRLSIKQNADELEVD